MELRRQKQRAAGRREVCSQAGDDGRKKKGGKEGRQARSPETEREYEKVSWTR